MQSRLKLAAAALAEKDYLEARKLASVIVDSKLPDTSPQWQDAATILSEANTVIFLSDMPLPGKKELYIVKSGDYLRKIAREFNTSVEAIQRSNNMAPTNINIRTGQTLCIYRGD